MAPPLDNRQFRSWTRGRPVFVSSVMDVEMTPAREAARAWITQWGGEPIMWEEITPRDQHTQDAYLDGVDRSDLFLLLLGSRYGVRDTTGYSPTHQEERRATQRGIPRLLFERAGVASNQRAGELNDWVRSLYNEVSAGKYTDPEDLVRKLEKQVREIASNQETPWVKLGPLVIPGTVERRGSRGTATYVLRAKVRDATARHAIAELTRWSHHIDADRLTWGVESEPIERVEVETRTVVASEAEVTLTCHYSANRAGSAVSALGGMTYNEGNRRIGPAEQVGLWADQALFDAVSPEVRTNDRVYAWTAPTGPTLPQILAREQARGWLAEGLVRLYIVEELLGKFGGRFERLDVGPATATGVRVVARFMPANLESRTAEIAGMVRLP